jgi:hypothetical protein
VLSAASLALRGFSYSATPLPYHRNVTALNVGFQFSCSIIQMLSLATPKDTWVAGVLDGLPHRRVAFLCWKSTDPILCKGNRRFPLHPVPLRGATHTSSSCFHALLSASHKQPKQSGRRLRCGRKSRGDYMAGRSLLKSVAFRSLALPQPAMPPTLGGLTPPLVFRCGRWSWRSWYGGYVLKCTRGKVQPSSLFLPDRKLPK